MEELLTFPWLSSRKVPIVGAQAGQADDCPLPSPSTTSLLIIFDGHYGLFYRGKGQHHDEHARLNTGTTSARRRTL